MHSSHSAFSPWGGVVQRESQLLRHSARAIITVFTSYDLSPWGGGPLRSPLVWSSAIPCALVRDPLTFMLHAEHVTQAVFGLSTTPLDRFHIDVLSFVTYRDVVPHSFTPVSASSGIARIPLPPVHMIFADCVGLRPPTLLFRDSEITFADTRAL